MSVINNVLKDLETRESHFTPIEITSVTPPLPARRDLKPAALALLLILLLAAASWIYLQQQSGPGAAAPMTNETLAVAAAKPDSTATVTAVGLAPVAVADVGNGVVTDQMIGNQIIGLQIRESEQAMRLEFVLRDKVVAYLKQRGENSFAYHLREIESQIVAPEISNNPWIDNLAITASTQGVDIQFETAPEILVETRQSLVDGEMVWAINLRKAIPRPIAAPIAAAVITEPAAAENTLAGELSPEDSVLAESVAQPAATEVASTARPQISVEQQSAPVVKLEIKSTNPNVKSANQLEYAVELINSRRYADAESLLRGLLGGAEDYSARQHLLALYDGQQHNDRFKRLARESATKYVNDVVFRTEYGRSLFQEAGYRAVIQLFSAETRLDPSQQALVAASYQRLDEHADAIRHYLLALKQDASNAKNWIGLGISQEHSSKLEAALESYQRAGQLGNLNSRLQAFVNKRSSMLRQVLN